MKKTKNNPAKIAGSLAIFYLIANFLLKIIVKGWNIVRDLEFIEYYPENYIFETITSWLISMVLRSLPVILFAIFIFVCGKKRKNYWLFSISFITLSVVSLIFIIWDGPSSLESLTDNNFGLILTSGVVLSHLTFMMSILWSLGLDIFGMLVGGFFAFDCLLNFKCYKVSRIIAIIYAVLILANAFIYLLNSALTVSFNVLNFASNLVSVLPAISYFVLFKFVEKTPE